MSLPPEIEGESRDSEDAVDRTVISTRAEIPDLSLFRSEGQGQPAPPGAGPVQQTPGHLPAPPTLPQGQGEPAQERDLAQYQNRSQALAKSQAQSMNYGSVFEDKLVGQTILGRYEIIERLGAGAIGVVYKARQSFMDRMVAIKTLRPQFLSDNEVVKRFATETKVLSRLNHKNIVSVFDCVFSEAGFPLFVMEFVQGRALDAILKERGKIPPEEVKEILCQVCDALQHAHKQGILHRDVKPANIVLVPQPDGTSVVKMVDFGLAKLKDDIQRLTQTGMIVGSPLYMSPEQAQGLTVDQRSDVYSLGVVAFEILTGVPPLKGQNVMHTLEMHCSESPPSMSEVAPDLDIGREGEAVIMKALEKHPDDRYQTVSQFKEALEFRFLGVAPLKDGSRASAPGVVDRKSEQKNKHQTKKESKAQARQKRQQTGKQSWLLPGAQAGKQAGRQDGTPAGGNAKVIAFMIVGIALGFALCWVILSQRPAAVSLPQSPSRAAAPVPAPAAAGTGAPASSTAAAVSGAPSPSAAARRASPRAVSRSSPSSSGAKATSGARAPAARKSSPAAISRKTPVKAPDSTTSTQDYYRRFKERNKPDYN